MIDNENKFFFIHIHKTAGTTIEKAFTPSAGNFENEVPHKHQTAYGMKKRFPKEWGEYFKFSFVRNPWDWLASRFFWQRQFHGQWKDLSFEKFIPLLCLGGKEGSRRESLYQGDMLELVRYGQYPFLSDENNNIIVDFIGRFENLQADFNKVCDKIGVSHKQLGLSNTSKHKHYTEYYNDYTEKLVREKYAIDIETFGYKFGK